MDTVITALAACGGRPRRLGAEAVTQSSSPFDYWPYFIDYISKYLSDRMGQAAGDLPPPIRDATEADLERIAEIKVRNWADTYGPLVPREALGPFLDGARSVAQLRELMRSPDTMLLVGPGIGVVQGFALTYMARSPEPWLESLHVVREERGHGLGRLLIRETARRLLAAGHRSMSLGVILGNDRASRFYELLGGVRVRVEPVDFADGVNHTVWRWPDLASLVVPG